MFRMWKLRMTHFSHPVAKGYFLTKKTSPAKAKNVKEHFAVQVLKNATAQI